MKAETGGGLSGKMITDVRKKRSCGRKKIKDKKKRIQTKCRDIGMK